MKTLAAKRVRWTVKDYFRMADAGLFDGRRVELLDGEVIEVSAPGHLHMRSIAGTASMLLPVFFPANMVAIQGTLPLGKYGAPDPDLYACDVPAGTPLDQIPLPFLVIEVSDTTYPKDSGIKLR